MEIIAVVAPPTYRTAERTGLALILIFFSAGIHINSKPFITESINKLESMSLSVAGVTLITAEMLYIFQHEPNSHTKEAEVATAFAFLANCALGE